LIHFYKRDKAMDSSDIFDTASQEGEEEYEEELSAAEVLAKLEEAWINERNSPELLHPRMEMVDCMLEQLKTMEGNLARLSKGDLRLPVHRMELQRIRFVINSYLRARLEKIESQVWHYTGPGEAGSRMTQEESAFATSFRESGTSLMNSLVLKHLPGGAWDPEKSVPALPGPTLSQAVFVKVLESREGIEVVDESGAGRDETVDLQVGAQHLLQYNVVRGLLDEGCVALI